MNRSRFAWWPLWRRRGRLSKGPEAALFQGLRIRLTLWYSLVLCAALVLFCVILYLGARHYLLTPVEDIASHNAQARAVTWFTGSPDRACSSFARFGPPPPARGALMLEMVVCLDKNAPLLKKVDPPIF